MPRTDVTFRSLIVATDVDVLSDTAEVHDRGEYVVVRSPQAPTHFWGNFIVWREPAARGDRLRCETAFAREFADQPRSTHLAFAWDGPAEESTVEAEFAPAGYDVETVAALVASPAELVAHPRANQDVEIRALDPRPGMDEALWAAAAQVQVASRDAAHSEAAFQEFIADRTADRRRRFVAGDGSWFVAIAPDGEVVASCGVIVTQGRARYQAVDTAQEHRRKGIATRLVHDAGQHAVRHFGAERLVIVADTDYHAIELYRSLGFAERERSLATSWWPTAPKAAEHPTRGHLATAAD